MRLGWLGLKIDRWIGTSTILLWCLEVSAEDIYLIVSSISARFSMRFASVSFCSSVRTRAYSLLPSSSVLSLRISGVLVTSLFPFGRLTSEILSRTDDLPLDWSPITTIVGIYISGIEPLKFSLALSKTSMTARTCVLSFSLSVSDITSNDSN